MSAPLASVEIGDWADLAPDARERARSRTSSNIDASGVDAAALSHTHGGPHAGRAPPAVEKPSAPAPDEPEDKTPVELLARNLPYKSQARDLGRFLQSNGVTVLNVVMNGRAGDGKPDGTATLTVTAGTRAAALSLSRENFEGRRLEIVPVGAEPRGHVGERRGGDGDGDGFWRRRDGGGGVGGRGPSGGGFGHGEGRGGGMGSGRDRERDRDRARPPRAERPEDVRTGGGSPRAFTGHTRPRTDAAPAPSPSSVAGTAAPAPEAPAPSSEGRKRLALLPRTAPRPDGDAAEPRADTSTGANSRSAAIFGTGRARNATELEQRTSDAAAAPSTAPGDEPASPVATATAAASPPAPASSGEERAANGLSASASGDSPTPRSDDRFAGAASAARDASGRRGFGRGRDGGHREGGSREGGGRAGGRGKPSSTSTDAASDFTTATGVRRGKAPAPTAAPDARAAPLSNNNVFAALDDDVDDE